MKYDVQQKLEWLAPLEAAPSGWKSTTRQNQDIRNLPFYITATCEPMMPF